MQSAPSGLSLALAPPDFRTAASSGHSTPDPRSDWKILFCVTDRELQEWWPDLGAVVGDLRRIKQNSAAESLLDAVRGGATSSEILGEVGAVLRNHSPLRAALSEPAQRAWDGAMKDVHRAFPGSQLAEWLARLTGR